MSNPNFITREELLKLLEADAVKLVDASWYLPAQNRHAQQEYSQQRIGNAVYFDIDLIADKSSDLPHMLPSAEVFSNAVGAMGINEADTIVIYDGPGVFSSARAWWTFKIMGAASIRILEGGIDGWKAAGLPLNTDPAPIPRPVKFNARPDLSRVIDLEGVKRNLQSRESIVIDARPNDRFTGEVAEPRPGLKSGHIPGSHSLPFGKLMEDGKMKAPEELKKIFSEYEINKDTPVITSCGSGVTAAILTLGLESVGLTQNRLYDGSWAEWGQGIGIEVETGQAE